MWGPLSWVNICAQSLCVVVVVGLWGCECKVVGLRLWLWGCGVVNARLWGCGHMQDVSWLLDGRKAQCHTAEHGPAYRYSGTHSRKCWITNAGSDSNRSRDPENVQVRCVLSPPYLSSYPSSPHLSISFSLSLFFSFFLCLFFFSFSCQFSLSLKNQPGCSSSA